MSDELSSSAKEKLILLTIKKPKPLRGCALFILSLSMFNYLIAERKAHEWSI